MPGMFRNRGMQGRVPPGINGGGGARRGRNLNVILYTTEIITNSKVHKETTLKRYVIYAVNHVYKFYNKCGQFFIDIFFH